MTWLLLVPVVVVLGFVWGAWTTVRAIRAKAFRAAGTWLRLAVLAGSATLLMYGFGAIVGSAFDTAETCEQTFGQRYDEAYRGAHWREPGQWFPLHNKCNAEYDLVPSYVNPSVVVLAAVAVGSVGVASVLAVRRRARRFTGLR